MANINVVVDRPIADGYKLKFRTPCDSTVIEGLEVKYPAKDGIGTLIKKFVFKDAHGTELSGVGNLFVSGVLIEVLLDVTHSVAYIQNADTNSYVESVKGEVQRLEEKQRQFLGVAGEAVEKCEQATAKSIIATEATKQATNTLVLTHEDFVSGGYVKALKELHTGNKFSFWVGTTDEYNALTEKVNNCFYILTDDASRNEIVVQLEELANQIKGQAAEIEANNNVDRQQDESIANLQSELEGVNNVAQTALGSCTEHSTQISELQGYTNNVASPFWGTLYKDHVNGFTASDIVEGVVEIDHLSDYKLVIFGVEIRDSSDNTTTFFYTQPAVRFDYGNGKGRYNTTIPYHSGGVSHLEYTVEGHKITGMSYDYEHELGDTVILKEIIGVM